MQGTVGIGTLIPATAGPELLLDRPKCQARGRAPASVGLEGRGHEEGQLRGRHPQVDSEHLAHQLCAKYFYRFGTQNRFQSRSNTLLHRVCVLVRETGTDKYPWDMPGVPCAPRRRAGPGAGVDRVVASVW